MTAFSAIEPMPKLDLRTAMRRFSIVGTTVKNPEQFPKDLVADAKHPWLTGERVSSATTAAKDGILGASVARSASETE
jgi:hypothetical protein